VAQIIIAKHTDLYNHAHTGLLMNSIHKPKLGQFDLLYCIRLAYIAVMM